MRAIVCTEWGTPDALRLRYIAEPLPKDGEVLIDVSVCTANFADVLMVGGTYQTRPALPFTPGLEASGRIAYAPDGRSITYLFDPGGGLSRELWRLDLASGQRERVFADGEQGGAYSREEALRRERQRQRETGVTDYRWAARAQVMLVPLRGDLYRLEDGRVEQIATGGVPSSRIASTVPRRTPQ